MPADAETVMSVTCLELPSSLTARLQGASAICSFASSDL